MQNRSRFLRLVLAICCLASLSLSQPVKDARPLQASKLAHTSGTPTWGLFNINNITTWIRADGESNHSPNGFDGAYFPIGTANVIYEDGLVFGGKVFLEATKTLPAVQPIRVGGGTYMSNIGTKAGYVTGSGATAVAADPNAPDVRVYRIRRDYYTMSDAEAARDAQSYFELASVSDVTPAQISAIRQQYDNDWRSWPVAKGAPFIDRNGNGVYDPPPPFSSTFIPDSLISQNRDEPGVAGQNLSLPADQVLWTVYNDLDQAQSLGFEGSNPLGLEVQSTVWGYKGNYQIGNVVFRRYRIINKGGVITSGTTKGSFWIDSMYVAQWSDSDIGNNTDDLAGCDSTQSLAYVYNGSTLDANFSSYGLPPPAVGYDIVSGPMVPASPNDTAIFNLRYRRGYRNLPMSGFSYFGSGSPYSDPVFGDYLTGTGRWWNMLRGYAPLGTLTDPPVYYSYPPTLYPTKFPLSGDPTQAVGPKNFIDGQGQQYSFHMGDRRTVSSTGPFSLAPGDTQEVVVALVAGLGADRLSSISVMKSIDRAVQQTYSGLFRYGQPVFKAGVSYPNSATAALTSEAIGATPRPASISVRVSGLQGSTIASVFLYDDGGHGDGIAGDGRYANTIQIPRQQSAIYLDATLTYNDGNIVTYTSVTDFLTTAGTLSAINPVVFSDNLNSDGNLNPGENIRFGFTAVNGTSFLQSPITCFVPTSQTNKIDKVVTLPLLNPGGRSSLSYGSQDPNSYLEFTVPSSFRDSVIAVPIVFADSLRNHWHDTLIFVVKPLSVPIKSSVVRHIRGQADGSFDVIVVNPSAVRNHIYLIVGVDSLPGTQGMRGFSLIDSTDGRVLLRNHTLPDALGHEVPVTDGFKVIRGTIGDSSHVGMKSWEIPSGTRRLSPVGGVTGIGLEGFSSAGDPTAYDVANGTIGMAGHFTFGGIGTTLKSADYHNVLLQWAAVPSTLWDPRVAPIDANYSKAYRWLRSVPVGGTAADPSFAPWIINRGSGYPYQDYSYGVPFSAWDLETTPPSRLAVGHFENNVVGGLIDGRYWPGLTGVDNSVAREFAFIFKAPYSTTADPAFMTNLSNNATLPLMWVMTCVRRNDPPYSSSDQFKINAYHPVSAADAWIFNPTVTEVASTLVPQQFSIDQNYPNPFNPSTTIAFTLPHPTDVSLKIYNLLGQEIATLIEEKIGEGRHIRVWNGTNRSGQIVASGIYFYRLQAGEFVETKKMILLR